MDHISVPTLIFSQPRETGVYKTHTFNGQALAKLNVLVAAVRTALKEIVSLWIHSPTSAFHIK
jgi:hypothetical protein